MYIKGAPRVISPPLQYASEGAEARVECLVQAVPPATRVQWFKDGMLIDTDKIQGYHINREPLPSGERNLLMIERATASDFGEYNCTVQNAFGEHSATINVERDRRAATTLLMFGATAAAIFIVLFAVTMTVCLRKKPPPQGKFSSKCFDVDRCCLCFTICIIAPCALSLILNTYTRRLLKDT